MEWTSCKEVFEISWEVNSIYGDCEIDGINSLCGSW